jgi:hypothetical protein
MRKRVHSDKLIAVAYKRTTVYIRQSVLDRLKKASRETGVPIAEMLRRGAELYLETVETKKTGK